MTDMEPDALVDETILMSVCAGLVVVDKDSSAVRLVRKLSPHWYGMRFNAFITDYTAQEYFQHIREARFPCAQVDITATCITYLSFDVFRRDCYLDNRELQSFLRSNSLLDYAARYWGNHARGHSDEIIQI